MNSHISMHTHTWLFTHAKKKLYFYLVPVTFLSLFTSPLKLLKFHVAIAFKYSTICLELTFCVCKMFVQSSKRKKRLTLLLSDKGTWTWRAIINFYIVLRDESVDFRNQSVNLKCRILKFCTSQSEEIYFTNSASNQKYLID